jgi:hypothetical protein
VTDERLKSATFTHLAPRASFSLQPFSRFDRIVGLTIGLLIAALILTILLGDSVGVTLQRVAPLGTARSTSHIVIQFSESMNRGTVPARLRVVQIPPEKAGQSVGQDEALATIEGASTWNGTTYTFRPSTALLPGATYQVMLEPGAVSETGREVLDEYRYSFTVRAPRVAFLAPADSAPNNIWVADPADLSSARQITFSPSGIYDYGVSPDGTKIAFSERNTSTDTLDIKVVDLETGAVEQVTNCADAACKTPVWRPDGQVIAYERVDYNSELGGQVGASPTRIWLIDLSARPASTRPLFPDSQMLGFGLRWSRDGSRVSIYDYNSQGILVYDFTTQATTLVPSQYGNPGELSPDGTQIIFPEVLLANNEARSYLQLVDLENSQITPLSNLNDPIDDDTAAWSPDGSFLVIGRRYLDNERFTRGKQLYKMNLADGSTEPLVVDPRYQNGFFSLDPTGAQLLIQRFPDPVAMNDPTAGVRPEIWALDLQTKDLVRVAENAFLARWVP